MDIIFVTDSVCSAKPLIDVANKLGHRILKEMTLDNEVSHYVESMRPDVLILLCNVIDRSSLREIRIISEQTPIPILVFSQETDASLIEAAIKAGASSFVVACDEPTRLGTLLDVAKARFEERQGLKIELQQAKKTLHERKSIEKAKGIIMQTKNLSEDQAYSSMRKLSMSQNKSISELAEQIIIAAKILI